MPAQTKFRQEAVSPYRSRQIFFLQYVSILIYSTDIQRTLLIDLLGKTLKIGTKKSLAMQNPG